VARDGPLSLKRIATKLAMEAGQAAALAAAPKPPKLPLVRPALKAEQEAPRCGNSLSGTGAGSLAHWKVRAPAATLPARRCMDASKRHRCFLLRLRICNRSNALDGRHPPRSTRRPDAGLACFRDAHQAVEHHSGVSELKRPGHRIGDRHRHEPVLPPPAHLRFLGRPVPTQRPKVPASIGRLACAGVSPLAHAQARLRAR